MKQLIILLLLIIAFFIGYGKYNQYKRYNAPEVHYKTDKKIDLDYYNQQTVINYHEAIECLNSYVMMQWTANNIDVRTPEDDDTKTKIAVEKYAKKLAKIKYYESKLEKSLNLKKKELSNKEIKYLVENGTDLKEHEEKVNIAKIKSMFDPSEKIRYGQKSALIYEVQKQLVKKDFDITTDGIYQVKTQKILKDFEEKNNLFADGNLDILTLDALFK